MDQTFKNLKEHLKMAEMVIELQGNTSISRLTSFNEPKYMLVPKSTQ